MSHPENGCERSRETERQESTGRQKNCLPSPRLRVRLSHISGFECMLRKGVHKHFGGQEAVCVCAVSVCVCGMCVLYACVCPSKQGPEELPSSQHSSRHWVRSSGSPDTNHSIWVEGLGSCLTWKLKADLWPAGQGT